MDTVVGEDAQKVLKHILSWIFPFNIRGGCIQGQFLIVPPPMRCKIQYLSVSLWSDIGKCHNFQYTCLEMSPKVVRARQGLEQTNMNI